MEFLELFSTSEPIALFSNREIAEFELVRFLQEIGAEAYPDGGFVGRLSSGVNHLWVNICHEEVTYLDKEKTEQIGQLLGALPKSCVILELSSEKGVADLAIYFIQKFSQKWSCVLSALTPNSQIYTANEITD